MLLLMLVLAAAPKVDTRLIGTWHLNGQRFVTLAANGAGEFDGERITWGVDGKTLVIKDEDGETERLPFEFKDGVLSVRSEGATLTLTKNAAAPRGAESKQATVATKPAPLAREPQQAPAGNDQLSRLLLSSNWCWVRYASGNSYTQKVHFSPNGTWQDFSESDISVNNQYAQVTAQATGNQQSGGRWAVRNGQFFLSEGTGPLEPMPLSVSYNSNGYPLITADGREYYQCN
jgi:hypothetical protein